MSLARFATAFAIAALVAALGACTTLTNAPTIAPSGPGTSAAPGATATIQPPTSFGPPPSPTPPDDSTPVVLDPALLAFLPELVDSTPVQADEDEAALALSDPVIPLIGTAVYAGVAVDAGNGNLVYAWIVKLRPGVFTLDKFREWRDAYDEGACTAAGGVVGRAEALIANRRVYVTSCVSGLRTYHVWLEAQEILISASALGDGRFGEKLFAGLRVPE